MMPARYHLRSNDMVGECHASSRECNLEPLDDDDPRVLAFLKSKRNGRVRSMTRSPIVEDYVTSHDVPVIMTHRTEAQWFGNAIEDMEIDSYYVPIEDNTYTSIWDAVRPEDGMPVQIKSHQAVFGTPLGGAGGVEMGGISRLPKGDKCDRWVLDVILHDGDIRYSRSEMVMDSLSWDEEIPPGMLELFSMDNVFHGISSSRDGDGIWHDRRDGLFRDFDDINNDFMRSHGHPSYFHPRLKRDHHGQKRVQVSVDANGLPDMMVHMREDDSIVLIARS